MSGLGVYVHWPYCAQKCPYCDFNSHVRETFDDERWGAAIARELDHTASMIEPREVTSIFFGGGTPSLASGRAVGEVIEVIARLWPLARDCEITLEANPNSVEQQRFRDYRAAGVNRVSIGVQALDDAALKALGRLHGADEARRAVALAMEIFPRTSFDLIYARPGQTAEAWRRELKEALAFGTEHLSLYQLTIEPGTAYATLARQGKLTLPDDDSAAALYETTQEMCEAAGLPAYEVSNHARAGAESRHNLIYWRYGDYVGVGPGAHGRLMADGARVATQAERLPEKWFEAVERDGHALTVTAIAREDAAREHLLMAMRLSEGLDLAAFEARWEVEINREAIGELQEAKLLMREGKRMAATARGRLVLNAVIGKLAHLSVRLPPASRALRALDTFPVKGEGN